MDKIVELKKLKSLLDQGAITDSEFQELKRKVLDSTFQQESSMEGLPTSNYNTTNCSSEENQRDTAKPTDANWQPPKETQANSAAIIFAVASAIAVFLPWVEVSSSASFGNYSSSYSSGGVSGINIPVIGIAGLAMALVGGGLAIAGTKWAAIFGIFNVLDGIGCIFGWFNAQGKASFSSSFGGSKYYTETGVHAQYGLYLFIVASFLFVIFSLTHESNSENTAKRTYQGFNAATLPAKYTKKTNALVFWGIILAILLLSILNFNLIF